VFATALNEIKGMFTSAGAAFAASLQGEAAEKLKLEQEFWKTLEDQAAVAALLPIEAENLKKQQELQKILGRDLLTTEQDRVNAALQLIRANEFLTSAKEASIEANRQAGIEEELTQKRVAGMREDQLDVERRVLEFRNDALAEGVDITDEAYLAAERQLRVDEERLPFTCTAALLRHHQYQVPPAPTHSQRVP
jgi:hypothetical protein